MQYHKITLLLPLLADAALAGLYGNLSKLNHTCALQEPVLSCSKGAQPGLVDSCCVETFGGLVLLTQYWNTYTGLENQGQMLPKDSWTVHGLWPDFCNGSYTQYCDLSRQYDPNPYPNTTTGKPDGTPVPPYTSGPTIGDMLTTLGKLDLLAWMNKYWLGLNEPSSTLWAHEFSKHATCFSTFDVECYGLNYTKHEEVVDYLATTAAFFRTLPTWEWLSAAGIRSSNTTGYSFSKIQDALAKGFGGEKSIVPYIGCSGPKFNETEKGRGSLDNGRTVLTEVWYYYYVYGRPQERHELRVPANVTGGSVGNCARAEGAVWYYERSKGSER